VIGVHHKATPALAAHAIEDAHAFFHEWRHTPAAARIEMTVRVASIIRARKLEFDAWLVSEAGKDLGRSRRRRERSHRFLRILRAPDAAIRVAAGN